MKRKLITPFLALTGILLAGITLDQVVAAPKQATKIKTPSIIIHSATVSPGLQAKLNTIGLTDSAGLVIVTGYSPSAMNTLSSVITAQGGVPGTKFTALGVVTAFLTKAQVLALQADPAVQSLWDNYQLYYNLHQARILCGVDKLRADAAMTAANGGHVVDGAATGDPSPNANPYPAVAQPNRPNISVVVIDSGLSTSGVPSAGSPTENVDLYYDNNVAAHGVLNAQGNGYTVPPVIPNSKIIQNVQVTPGVLTGDPSIYLENQNENDSVGHGSHCAGIIGGLGTFSKTTPALTGPNGSPTGPGVGQTEDFSGVASGVRIIGCGSGAGLFVLDALGGFNYAINFRQFYNIRVTSNSYGSTGAYDPADPLNVAIKTAYDNGITTVFAAGNSGPGVDTISNNSKSPYVICVAAGTKEGGLVGFSSRGKPAVERTVGSVDEFNLPAITAPGTGREFDFNTPGNAYGKGFYSDIISTRSKIPGAAAGTNDQEFPAPYQANYTQISGTSMACPFIAGTCALLLDANPGLTPAGVKNILQATATHMPDYQDYEVGSGYVNVYAAIDKALNPTKPFGPFYTTNFNAVVTSTKLPPSARPLEDNGTTPYPPASPNPPTPDANLGEDFTMPYSQTTPAATYSEAKTKATTYPSNNAYAFSVIPDANTGKVPSILDVRLQFGQDSVAGEVGGNTLGLYLWAPDGTFYSSGVSLPILDSPSRQVVVRNPIQGTWIAELRPVRGLAAVPITPPVGVGLPDTTTGQIYRTNLFTQDPPDITELPQKSAIQFALTNRYLDILPDGTFQPTAAVTKGTFAQALADNTPLRQSLASASSKFSDISGPLARAAEALSVFGSTLRDWDFTPAPTLGSGPTGTPFGPNTPVSRSQTAVSLVRALGLDKEAQAIASKPVQVTYNGTVYNVVDANDSGQLDPSAKGYVQMALNRGILTYYVNHPPGGATQIFCYPSKPMIRADLAVALGAFRQVFRTGNTLAASENP